MKKMILSSALTALIAAPVMAHDFGFAGLLSSDNMEELEEITLSVGKPLADA